MEHISAILSDLDGTLFRNDKSISPYTKDIIAAAREEGILFGIATSRALVNAEKFLGGISADILITNGGGLLRVGGKKIYSCAFSAGETRCLIRSAFDVLGSGAVISLDNEHGFYSNSKDELGDKFWTFNDFSDFDGDAMKLCVRTRDRDAAERIASSIGLGQIDLLPFSDIPWFKLSKKGATKECAVRVLCDYLGLPAASLVAFGDDFSDIAMLRLCGRGIAPANAIGEVKLAADEICGANEADGVAGWIERHVLRPGIGRGEEKPARRGMPSGGAES